MKISTKLFYTILAMFSSLLIAGYVSYQSEKKALTVQIHNHLSSVASLQKDRLSIILARNMERLRLVASRTQLRLSLRQFLLDGKGEHQDRMHRILVDARNAIPSFKNIEILTREGRIAASTNKEAVGSFCAHDGKAGFLSRAYEGEMYIDFYLCPDDGLMFLLCAPLVLDGETLGVIVIDSEAVNIIEAVQDYTGLGKSGETLLLAPTQNGGALFLAPTRFDQLAALKRTISAAVGNNPAVRSLQGGEQFFPETIDYRREPVLAASRVIDDPGWSVVVKFDRKEAFAPLHGLRNRLLVIICGFTLVIVIAAVFLTRSITLPLAGLTEAARDISRGSSAPVEITSGDEIGVLAVAFNTMTAKLAAANAELVANNELLDKIFSTTHVLLAYMDKDCNFIRVNDAYASAYCRTPDSFIGQNYFTLFPDPDREGLYHQVVTTGRPYTTFADALGRPDRTEKGVTYWDWSLQPVLDRTGKTEGLFLILKDVTEWWRMEEQLHLIRSSVNNIKDCIFWVDEQAQFQFVNDTACRTLGYTREELLAMTVFDIDPFFPAAQWPEHWREIMEKGSLTVESVHRTKDGREFPVEITTNRVAYSNKVFNCAIARDITERKQAEDALRASEASLRIRETLLNESQRLGQIGSWDWDAVKDSIWWSDEYYRIYGIDPEKPTPNYVEHLKAYTPESAGRLDAVVKRAMETGEPYELDLELARPTASTRWIVARGEAKRDASGRITGLRGTAQNITERKASEDALRERESFIRNILDSVDEGFIVVDREYGIVSANRAFCDFMKLPEDRIVGRPCHRITHRLDRPCFESGEDCAIKRTFETGGVHTSFHTHEIEDGVKQYVEIKSYPITDAGGRVVSAIETVNDVTERRKLEEQLRQAQKMKAIGTLAGGIAHDFNNILTAIMGYANIIKMKMRPDDPQLPSIDQILASSDRAASLTQGLLAFSRKQVIKPRPVDLNDIVRNVEKLLQRIIGEDITLTTELSGTSLIVMADSVQIEQVLMNFATNARDAMPHGGTLTISTREVDLGEDFVAMHGFGKPGRHALIAVSDTGQGMDEMTREHIFDPFFTTKEPGRGTGLGLAIVYGIVKQHNGNINVYSEPGKGTTFKIYLPLIEKPVETTAEEEPAAAPRRGTETVLLAEDDRDVRTLTAMILKEYGYTVIEAVDGEDAVARFKERERDIDLLLLDVIMPRKSGKEAYDAIKALRPELNALFISGYTADMLDRKGISEEGLECISKPISPFELLRKVRDILDGKNVAPG